MKPPIIVLVRPQAYGNIGAMARSMSNFGFSEIRIVGKVPTPESDHAIGEQISQSDWALATPRGHQILKNLRIYPDLESAIADCHILLGTSGKKEPYRGGYSRKVLGPSEAFDEARILEKEWPESETFRSALIFGPEDDGLSAEEASHCDLLIHIPTSMEAPSMNLAMAATLIFFAFYTNNHAHDAKQDIMAKGRKPRQASRDTKSNAGQIEALVNYVFLALEPTQFFKLPDADSTQARLRRVLRSWKLSQGDLLFVFEIFYQLKCWGQDRFETRDFLRK